MSQTSFCSGHTDLSIQEFKLHYVDKLNQAISDKNSFVIGNAKGADTMIFEYLLEKKVPFDCITIFVFDRYKNNNELSDDYQKKYGVNTVKGFSSYAQRDAAMTEASQFDIAWVRSVEDCKKLYQDKYRPRVSGTEQNLLRRSKLISNCTD